MIKHIAENHRWIKLLFGVMAVLLLALMINTQSEVKATQLPMPIVTIAKADIEQQVLAAAVVKPKVKLDVGAQVTGQISSLSVEVGQLVQQGDILLTIDPSAARNDVKRAQAELTQQELSLQSRRIDLAQAQSDHQRQKRLLAADATSQLEHDKARDSATKIALDVRIHTSRIAKLKADLANAQLKLQYTSVTAPMSGTVVSIGVQVGQSVNAQNQSPTVVSLAKLDTMTVWARVSEADVRLITPGQKAAFKPLGESDRWWHGHVRLVRPVPEKINGAAFYKVLFDVPNTFQGDDVAGYLMMDMSGQAVISIAQVKQVPVVPVSALAEQLADGGFAVYVPGEAGNPVQRSVKVGMSDIEKVQIISGLDVGEQVFVVPPIATLERPVAQ